MRNGKSWLKTACIITGVCLVFCSCTYSSRNEDLVSPCNTATVNFQLHVKPILEANCIACHSTADPAGGLNFESYSGVLAPAMDGRLVGSIKHLAGFKPMPELAPMLSDCDITKIEIWVNKGALND